MRVCKQPDVKSEVMSNRSQTDKQRLQQVTKIPRNMPIYFSDNCILTRNHVLCNHGKGILAYWHSDGY